MGYNTYSRLYESLVTPVVDYGSAIWGTKGYSILDKIQNRATRFFTGVHKFAPTLGHVGDMGWCNNRGRWDLNALRLWNRLVCLDDHRITKKIFNWDIKEHNESNKANFCAHVKQILCEMGKKESYRRTEQVDLISAKAKIIEHQKSRWSEEVAKLSKLDLLTKIKNTFGVESFLKINIDRYDRSLLSQFRDGILPLEIETGRYKGLPREERICSLCNTGIEDQIHFALKCPVYNNFRNEFNITCIERIPNWATLNDTQKIVTLFNDHSRLFGKYVKKIFVHRKSLLFN